MTKSLLAAVLMGRESVQSRLINSSQNKWQICTETPDKCHQAKQTQQQSKWLLTSSVLPGLNSIFLELGT